LGLAAAAACLLAVVIAVLLIGESPGGNRPDGAGDNPSGPVATGGGGFGASAVPAPHVTSSYDAATRTLTFSWIATSSASIRYFYSINGATPVGPTGRTSIPVTTASPSTTCIVVAAVGSDGIRHLAASVCG
jgi:hypothetical protein